MEATLSPPLVLRDATREDLAEVVSLILPDSLSSHIEGAADEAGPMRAFEAIEDDPNNQLAVAERDGKLIGTMQLTCIPQLTLHGGLLMQIENVRVDSTLRSSGIGRQMIEWATGQARERGCAVVQLMSNGERVRAFYEQLGLNQSHLGFKLVI
jgi:N-acetylglutamate synthase-like GNAT family acetyltransferase